MERDLTSLMLVVHSCFSPWNLFVHHENDIRKIHSKWLNCDKKILRNYQVFARPTAKIYVPEVRNDALPTQENMDRFPNALNGKL